MAQHQFEPWPNKRYLPEFINPSLVAAAADIDGDGDLDLLVDQQLLRNDGRGQLTRGGTAVPVAGGSVVAAAFGDIDGDGDPDLLLGVVGQSSLLINNGSGGFADQTAGRLPLDSSATQAVLFADLDGDGDLDIVLGNGGGLALQNVLWLNDGTGHFSDASPQLPTHLDHTESLAAGDLDGDGDLDLVLGSSQGDPSRLYLNDGAAHFTDASQRQPAGAG